MNDDNGTLTQVSSVSVCVCLSYLQSLWFLFVTSTVSSSLCVQTYTEIQSESEDSFCECVESQYIYNVEKLSSQLAENLCC